MIGERDTLRFAPGVALEGDRLSDVVRGASWPLNASGAFVLARATQPIGETVPAFARAYSLPPDEARDDVLQFVWSLNGSRSSTSRATAPGRDGSVTGRSSRRASRLRGLSRRS